MWNQNTTLKTITNPSNYKRELMNEAVSLKMSKLHMNNKYTNIRFMWKLIDNPSQDYWRTSQYFDQSKLIPEWIIGT